MADSVRRGEIYWIEPEHLRPSVDGVAHPHVVVQDDLLNLSRIPTTVVCGISSQKKKAEEPGNVFLEAGEGGLSKASVVAISQVSTVDKAQLGERVGTLSPERVDQILAGLESLPRRIGARE
ncbi:MAG: PemK family transcriptional regulator [Sorangiineae bacterium NIC37A_2]|nr:MAG: PemK family transcriptional regulator [Sorangiineae bacterium NIC37A_2]